MASASPWTTAPRIEARDTYSLHGTATNPLDREHITQPLVTGIRAIDSLLPCGKGQRIGIFGGSGVGKSTLLGSMSRHNSADVTVIAMIGERNREVRGFLENELGPEGRKRSVVVCATSDRPAPLRVRACFVALAVAEYFRDQGANVLLVMDSVTRLAMAQREIGLAAGEPPSQKGYTPSVFNLLPKVFERAGNFRRGSITGFFTVLVEGDDFNEPICDAVRGILDGHIILSRQLGAQGHYPAIDILHSVSRLTSAIATPAQKEAARKIRGALSAYRDAEDLIQLGAYVSGSNPAARRQHPSAPRAARFPPPGSPGQLAPARDALASGRTGRAHGHGPRAGPSPLSDEDLPIPPRKGPRVAPHPTRTRRSPLQTAGRPISPVSIAGAPKSKPPASTPKSRSASGIPSPPAISPPSATSACTSRRRKPRSRASASSPRKKLGEQQKVMLEARRRCRLLERLKERRLAEWTAERDRELDEIAAESYLARWSRGSQGTDKTPGD